MATTLRPSDSINELDLPMRAHSALWRNDVRTVEDLVALTEDEMLRWRAVGPGTVAGIKERLAAHGLGLSQPMPPPDPETMERARWLGHQLEALAEDTRVYGKSGLGTRWDGDGAAILNRRRAWAWYRWGTMPDAEWPRDKAGGFGFMAVPLPGSMELHLEGLNRLAHEELGSSPAPSESAHYRFTEPDEDEDE